MYMLALVPIVLARDAAQGPAFFDRRVGVAGSSLGRGFFTQKELLAPAHPLVTPHTPFCIAQLRDFSLVCLD